MNDPLGEYRKWRRSLWPMERWAADAAVGTAVLTILLWVTK
jgi:hypothetical protein